MAGLSNYWENELCDHMMRDTAGSYTTPANATLKLYTTSPNWEDGTGGTEVSGGGYSSKTVALTSTNFNAAANQGTSGARLTNKATSAFQWSAATADWGTVNGAGFWDGANLLWGDDLDTPVAVYTDDPFEFPASALKFDLDVTTEAGVTQFWKKKALDHAFGVSAYDAPTTVYLALYSVAPNVYTGSGGTELTVANGYARKSLTMASVWDAATGGLVDNTAEIAFNACTGSSWADVVAVMAVDTASGTINEWYFGKTFTAVSVDPGDTFKFTAGNLGVTLA